MEMTIALLTREMKCSVCNVIFLVFWLNGRYLSLGVISGHTALKVNELVSVKFLADAHAQMFGLAEVESKLLMTAEVVLVGSNINI